MSITKRSRHLAVAHKKYRIRRKNTNRFLKQCKVKINIKDFRIEGCLGLANFPVFHEYEQPEDVYIKKCKEEGLI